MFVNEFVNLDTTYVVAKRDKNCNYFYRSGRSKTVTTISLATRFNDKESAKSVADAWTLAQRKKFEVYPLSKFMVNDFSLNYSNIGVISVRSKPKLISSLHKNINNINADANSCKHLIVSGIAGAVEYRNREINWKQDTVNKYQQEIEKAKEDIRVLNVMRETVHNTDLNTIVEPMYTDSDKKIKILFGKETTTEKKDSGSTDESPF